MKSGKNRPRLSGLVLGGLLTVSLFTGYSTVAQANTGLNGIGTPNTEQTETTTNESVTQSENTGNADAVGSMFQGVGIDEEASAKANSYIYPIAQFANLVMALILSVTFIAMMVITVLDLLYIAVPPVRSMLYAGSSGGSSGGMGFGGSGFGGGGQQSSSSGKQWISDEAKAVVGDLEGSSGGNSGGFGGGMGFGGSGFGGGGSQPEKSKKSVITSYAKKRVVFLVVFGVVALLLTSTIFTDIGVNVGAWLMDKLLSFNSSF